MTNSDYPLSPRGKDFLLLKTQFARKYTLCQFTWFRRIFNKQFWQQNLATSKFLVNCLLLTATFLSSWKQYHSFTLEHHRLYHQLLRRWGYGVVRILWSSANWIIVLSSKTHKNKSHRVHNINNSANIILLSMKYGMGHTQRKWFIINKEVYQKSSYGSDALSETPFPILKHLEFT